MAELTTTSYEEVESQNEKTVTPDFSDFAFDNNNNSNDDGDDAHDETFDIGPETNFFEENQGIFMPEANYNTTEWYLGDLVKENDETTDEKLILPNDTKTEMLITSDPQDYVDEDSVQYHGDVETESGVKDIKAGVYNL